MKNSGYGFVSTCLSYAYVIRKHRNIKRSLARDQHLFKKAPLTKEQQDAVIDLWRRNGYTRRVYTQYHSLYTALSGKFDVRYFPEVIFENEMVYITNKERFAIYTNKAMQDIVFGHEEDIVLPETVLVNCDGVFLDKERRVIDLEHAIRLLDNVNGEVVIKPTFDSNSGKNVMFYRFVNGVDDSSGQTINNVLNRFNKNYIVQKLIEQAKCLADLYPHSVNTIRINTYICDDRIGSSPIALRLGRNNKRVDNSHSGGIAVGVSDDGYLRDQALTQIGESFTCHPDTKAVFHNRQLPFVPEMIKTARRLHTRIPNIGVIAWDFTANRDNRVVLIEANASAPSLWFPQYCNGEAFFRDDTEAMIRMLSRSTLSRYYRIPFRC